MSKAVMLEPIGGGGETKDFFSECSQYLYNYYQVYTGLYDLSDWDGDINLHLKKVAPPKGMFRSAIGASGQNVYIKFDVPPTDLDSFLYNVSFASLTLDGDLSQVTTYGEFAHYTNTKCNFEFDFTSVTSENGVKDMFAWKATSDDSYIRFKKNTLGVSITIPSSHYINSTDSLVSIANGLRMGVIGKSISLSSPDKTKLSAIVGYVDSDNFFTADPQGTMTLTDFITNVKGWTIA